MHFEKVQDSFYRIAIFNSCFISIFKPCPMDPEYENSLHATRTIIIVNETRILIKRSHINEDILSVYLMFGDSWFGSRLSSFWSPFIYRSEMLECLLGQ
jgi:hypothetical protein